VLAENESVRTPSQELLGLEFGDDPFLDQGPGNDPAALGIRQAVRQGSKFLLADQSALAEIGQECLPACGWDCGHIPEHRIPLVRYRDLLQKNANHLTSLRLGSPAPLNS